MVLSLFSHCGFLHLSRDGALNSLFHQTFADLNRKLLISKHSWAKQPAALPSASCPKPGLQFCVQLQGREPRVGSVLQLIMWWFHRPWEQKLGYSNGQEYLLSLLLNCFLLFLPLNQPWRLITAWSIQTLRQSFQHWARSCWDSFLWIIKSGHSSSTSIPFPQAVFMNVYSSWNDGTLRSHLSS